ncbi:MAG: carboxypeptidase regulatory-like domain-containing protein [Candidatus Eremiobacteraeota bacterium]|nr:carboxypeptidase regulatory-like domain-containing protein [Candidatus Eremiobacteraeota bacterium]
MRGDAPFAGALIVIFLLLGHTVLCQNTVDPGLPPGIPAEAPPLTGAFPFDELEDHPPGGGQGGAPVTVTYSLAPGWNIISFPFSSLKSCSGFTHMLYHYAGGNYYAIDPVHYPAAVNTRWAYLAYSETPVTASATGFKNTTQVRSVDLATGWNLIGCPSDKPVPLSRVAIMSGSTARSLSEAADPGSPWLSPVFYRYNGAFVTVNLDERAVTKPLGGAWVYAWHPLKIVLRGRKAAAEGAPGGAAPTQASPAQAPPAQEGPVITALVPARGVPAGEIFAVQGRGFGNEPGQLFIGELPVARTEIMSWSNSRIEARVPAYAQSGKVVVHAGRVPSNAVALTVQEASLAPAFSTVIGKVQASDATPLRGARILLDNGLSAYSRDDGTYSITNVPPGVHGLTATLQGYNTGKGDVHLRAGETDSVLITLSSKSSAPQQTSQDDTWGDGTSSQRRQAGTAKPERGTLHIVADAYDDQDHHWWVSKIDVHEWGNFNRHWYNDWDSNYGDQWFQLECDGAMVGQTYIVEITWKSSDGGGRLHNSWYRKMYSTDQTETIDSPF